MDIKFVMWKSENGEVLPFREEDIDMIASLAMSIDLARQIETTIEGYTTGMM
jgi:hypothetical protein